MKLLLTYISFSFSLLSIASDSLDAFQQGNIAFGQEKFDLAIQHYTEEISTQPGNTSAFFNLGLAYSAKKEYGKAIWAFEKVLRLNPNDAEAIDNIEQNYGQLDNGTSYTPPLGRFNRALFSLGSQSWSVLSILFSIATALGLILFRKSNSFGVKRLYLMGSILFGVLFTFSVYTATRSYHYESQDNFAIVTKAQITTYSSDDASVKVKLVEGTKVQIESYQDTNCVVITLHDQQKHNISSSDIERI